MNFRDLFLAGMMIVLPCEDVAPREEVLERWVCRINVESPAGFDFLEDAAELEGDITVQYEDDCPGA